MGPFLRRSPATRRVMSPLRKDIFDMRNPYQSRVQVKRWEDDRVDLASAGMVADDPRFCGAATPPLWEGELPVNRR